MKFAWYYEDEPIQGTGANVWSTIECAVEGAVAAGRDLDEIRVGELRTWRPSDLIDAECVLDEIRSALSARVSTAESVTAIPEFAAHLAALVDACVDVLPSEICEGRQPLPVLLVQVSWIWGAGRPGESHALITYSTEPHPITGMTGWTWVVEGHWGREQTLREASLAAGRQPLPVLLVQGSWIWGAGRPGESHALITYSTEPHPITGMTGWTWVVEGHWGREQTLREASLAAARHVSRLEGE